MMIRIQPPGVQEEAIDSALQGKREDSAVRQFLVFKTDVQKCARVTIVWC